MEINNKDLRIIHTALEYSIYDLNCKITTPNSKCDTKYWTDWIKEAERLKNDINLLIER